MNTVQFLLDFGSGVIGQLQSPTLAFLIGGAVLAASGSKLSIPGSIYQFVVFVLLMKIGIEGGIEIREARFSQMALPAVLSALTGVLIVLLGRAFFALVPGVRTEDGIATAGLFGAVSSSTLAAAILLLEERSMPFEAWVPALYPFMDIPALILAILLANLAGAGAGSGIGSRASSRAGSGAHARSSGGSRAGSGIGSRAGSRAGSETGSRAGSGIGSRAGSRAGSETGSRAGSGAHARSSGGSRAGSGAHARSSGHARVAGILRESLQGPALSALLLGLALGLFSQPERVLDSFYDPLFRGLLSILMLILGMEAWTRLRELVSVAHWFAIYALIGPVVHGAIGFGLGWVAHELVGFSPGGVVLMAVIAASNSDISGPPTLRGGIPGANPSAYIGASTSLGTPVAIAVCIPLFHTLAMLVFPA